MNSQNQLNDGFNKLSILNHIKIKVILGYSQVPIRISDNRNRKIFLMNIK